MTRNPTDELAAAVAAARAAGEILRAGFGRAHDVQFKGPIDPVTEADRASEARIVALLAAATPGCGFLTEENPAIAGRGDARWIIDPLDGTVNYAPGYPHFAVSIALERGGELELGVIYDPLRDELFVARRGAGATLNGRPIHVGSVSTLGGAVLSTGFPYDVWTSEHDNTAEWCHFLKRAQSLRVTGSSALDLAAVACGRRDGHWEPGLSAYDTAAGVLLVREAGGVATDYGGGPDALYGAEIVAANPALHAEMLSYLRGRHRER